MVNGERAYAPITFDSQAEAEAWLDGGAQTAGEVCIEHTFGEYAHEWMHMRAGLRPGTISAYYGLLNKWVLPFVGDLQLNEMTVRDARVWVAGTLVDAGGRTRAAAFGLARTIAATAVQDGLLPSNPFTVPGAGTVPRRERDPRLPLAGELAALEKALGDQLGALVPIMAWGALRVGEALGTSVADLNKTAGTITVRRTVGARSEVGPPKTREGRRTLTLPARAWPSIEARIEVVGTGWLFPAWTDATKPLSYGVLQPRWREAAKVAAAEAGAPEPLLCHDLRHHGLSKLAEVGATVPEIAEAAGWSRATAFELASVYVHAAQGSNARNAARLDALEG